jgi:hypothetical protein
MGQSFNPAKDIGSLEGKVILVTGGKCPAILDMSDLITDLMHG